DDDVFHEQPMIDVSAQENEEEEETPPKQRGKRRSKKQRREENVDTDSDRLSEEESEEEYERPKKKRKRYTRKQKRKSEEDGDKSPGPIDELKASPKKVVMHISSEDDKVLNRRGGVTVPPEAKLKLSEFFETKTSSRKRALIRPLKFWCNE